MSSDVLCTWRKAYMVQGPVDVVRPGAMVSVHRADGTVVEAEIQLVHRVEDRRDGSQVAVGVPVWTPRPEAKPKSKSAPKAKSAAKPKAKSEAKRAKATGPGSEAIGKRIPVRASQEAEDRSSDANGEPDGDRLTSALDALLRQTEAISERLDAVEAVTGTR